MKPFFKLSVLLFIFFLFGCTITKRKYTGGYYVSWHHKAQDVKSNELQTTHAISNAIIISNNNPKDDIVSKTEKYLGWKFVQTSNPIAQETSKLIVNADHVKYTLHPENITQVQGTNQHEISRVSPPLFGLLSILPALLSFIGISGLILNGVSVSIVLFLVIMILLTAFFFFLSLHTARKILKEFKENPPNDGKVAAICGIVFASIGLSIALISTIYLCLIVIL